MTKTIRTAVPEKERLEVLQSVTGKTVTDMQNEVDATVAKVKAGTSTEIEEHRAAVLAKVILDRRRGL